MFNKTIILGLFLFLVFPVNSTTLSGEILLPGYEKTSAHAPALAKGNETCLLVWQAGINAKSCIVGMRLKMDGTKIDPQPFLISDAAEAQEAPRISYGNGLFLVVWDDLRSGRDYDVYGARVKPDGVVLDPNGIAIAVGAHNQFKPAICHMRNGFYIAWRAFKDSAASGTRKGYIIVATTVTGDGVVTGPDTLPQESGFMFAGPPSLASINQDSAVLHYLARGSWAGMGLTHKSCMHILQDGKSIAYSFSSKQAQMVREHSLSSDGVSVMVNWSTWRNNGGRCGWGEDVTGGMVLLNSKSLYAGSPAPVNPYRNSYAHFPVSSWDGSNYVVAWEWDDRKTLTKIFFTIINKLGVSQDSAITVEGTRANPAAKPALVSDLNGNTLVAYEQHPAAGDIPIKIAVRTITSTESKVEASKRISRNEGFILSPNPFASAVSIVLTNNLMDKQPLSNVDANVYTLQGRNVASLKPHKVSVVGSTATRFYSWNGGRQPNGIYLIRVRQGSRTWLGKIVLAK